MNKITHNVILIDKDGEEHHFDGATLLSVSIEMVIFSGGSDVNDD